MKDSQQSPDYSVFVNMYDSVMEHINYHIWANFLLSVYKRNRLKSPKSLLDIACGSGELLKKFKSLIHGKLHGIDISPQMAELANLKLLGSSRIQVSPMTKIPFPDGSFDFITNTHDSLNYLITEEDLHSHFREVHRVMQKGGMYIVDITSEENIYKYFHNKTKKFKKGKLRLTWSNFYHHKTNIIESRLEFLDLKSQVTHTELHRQKYYPQKQIIRLAGENGLKFIENFYDYHFSGKEKGCSLIVLVFIKPDLE